MAAQVEWNQRCGLGGGGNPANSEIEDLAFKHQPLLFMRDGTMSPPALGMWWEAVDAGDTIALIYHPVWQDEVHPIPWVDKLYRVYRAIYYGFPIRDIEYIQVNIRRSDGLIQRIRYEDTSADSYYALTSNHRPVIINQDSYDYVEQSNQAKKISVNGRPSKTALWPCPLFGPPLWHPNFSNHGLHEAK